MGEIVKKMTLKARVIDHHTGASIDVEFQDYNEMMEYALQFSNPVLVGAVKGGPPCESLSAEGEKAGVLYQISKRGHPLPGWKMKPTKQTMHALEKWHDQTGNQ